MNQSEQDFQANEHNEYESDNSNASTALALLDHLHDLVVEARSVPMSASALLNRAQVLDMLDQIREALPRDVLTADDIVSRADAVLNKANAEADSHMRDAQVRAEKIADTARQEAETITTNATNQADLLISEANTRAEQIIADAQAQSDRMVTAEYVLQEATERAHETKRSAESEAERLIVSANEYALDKMNELMQAALNVARTAEAGKNRIDTRLAQAEDSSENGYQQ